ncbi:hypothetical protein AB0M20_00505 [Actinoplanes sp. NPDC051633]|uniref:hypothetical protein n=1 Tax=Actinoplanes sp. NPDC051633 TaxID=3155670 RepID=UPI003445F8C7
MVAPNWQRRLSRQMRSVVDWGFYSPVEPYEEFEDRLTASVIGPELEHAVKGIGVTEARLPDRPPALDSDAMLYTAKLSPSVTDLLVQEGYAAPHPDNPFRLYGSPRLMHLVISIIAARIAAENNAIHGNEGPGGLHPHTDLQAAFRMNVDPVAGRRVADGWKIDIGPLLPVPGEGVDLTDLWHFRERHEPARQTMMDALTELLSNLENRHPRDAYARVERQLADAREQIVRYGRESGISLWLRKGVLVTVAVAAEYAGQTADIPGLGTAAAALAVISGLAVNVTSTSVRQPGRLEHDYRYLHLTESEFSRSGFAPGDR